MGDRSNVEFKHESGSIYLYAHWGGPSLAGAVLTELVAPVVQGRWSDPPYLTRLLVQRTLTAQGADPNEPTGFGLSPVVDDNQYPILVVDCTDQTVSVRTESGEVTYGPVPFAALTTEASAGIVARIGGRE